jgi:hypothetical protein
MPSDITEFDFNLAFGETFTVGPQFSNVAQLCGPLLDTLRTGSDPVIALATYARANAGLQTMSLNYLRNETAANESEDRCWFWVTCNELAYWQTSPGRIGLRGVNLTTAGFEEKCRAVFNDSMPPPDVDKFNSEHNLTRGNNVSHIAFVTDSQDPWAWTCIGPDIDVDDDNWVYTIKGTEVGHHREFNNPTPDDPEDMKRARENLIMVLDKWLAQEANPAGQ